MHFRNLHNFSEICTFFFVSGDLICTSFTHLLQTFITTQCILIYQYALNFKNNRHLTLPICKNIVKRFLNNHTFMHDGSFSERCFIITYTYRIFTYFIRCKNSRKLNSFIVFWKVSFTSVKCFGFFFLDLCAVYCASFMFVFVFFSLLI